MFDVKRKVNYMITGYHDTDTEEVFQGGKGNKNWESFVRVARRKLLMLNAATALRDLKSPPNNKLEALKKERKGQHSIRVNDQYRICFIWDAGNASSVEITDYHQ